MPAELVAITCPSCGQSFKGQREWEGRTGRCPSCKKSFVVTFAPPRAVTPELPTQAHTQNVVRMSQVPAVSLPGSSRASPEGPTQQNVELTTGGFEKYQVLGEIERGGMGAILQAHDRDINRLVAMKVMLEPERADRNALVRFLGEAQATGQLEHPNIVPVHEVGLTARGELYFTMKLVRGRSLSKVIRSLREGDPADVGQYSLNRVLQILLQVCQAVAFAHSRGVVHCDLKPGNVMLGEFGEVLLMDWGLAKILAQPHRVEPGSGPRVQLTDASTDTEVAGSPNFMAPEQALGKVDELDELTDVYSLGGILFNVTTLRLPFVGKDGAEVAHKVVSEPPEPFVGAKVFGRVPKEVRAIALKALSKDKASRYASARALADDIQRFLDGLSVQASPDGPLRRAWKWAKRHRAASLGTAAVLAVALATFRGTVAYQDQRQRAAQQAAIAEHLEAAKKDAASGNYTRVEQTGDSYASALQLRNVQEKLSSASSGLLAAAGEYREVLRLDPSNSEVLGLLADDYAKLWKLAFFQGDTRLMESYAQEVKSYAGASFEARYGRLLRGDGSLKVALNTIAEAHLFRFEQDDAQYGRLVLLPVGADGSCTSPEDAGYPGLDAGQHQPPPAVGAGPFPDSLQRFTLADANRLGAGAAREIALDPIPLGSYLVVLTAPGRIPIRVPFLVDRDEHGAGRAVEVKAALPRSESQVPGFTYVPQVEALLGSSQAAGALFPSPRRKVVGAFFIQSAEVSVPDYLAFVEDLASQGHPDEARARLPKSFDPVATSGERVRAELRGLHARPIDPVWAELSPEELASQPIAGVTWLDAQAYTEWKASKDGRAYRLPSDEEWEVAARGADGRTYSWGEIYRPEAARLTQGYGMISASELAMLNAAHSSYDESVFGVTDLGGSVAEWVGSDFIQGSTEFKSIRGNAWGLTPNGLQCAFRATGSSLNYFHSTIGFRMAMDVPQSALAP